MQKRRNGLGGREVIYVCFYHHVLSSEYVFL